MLFTESVRIAVNALFANKMRSLLTMLGIIIGVGAVIAMVAVGMGVTQRVTDSIASLGSNMLIIRPGASMSGGLRGAAGSRTTLKYEDATAIKKKIKDIDYVSPTVQKNYQVVYGNQNWNTSVTGVTQEYMSIRDLRVMTGSFITEDDMNTRNRVAVITMPLVALDELRDRAADDCYGPPARCYLCADHQRAGLKPFEDGRSAGEYRDAAPAAPPSDRDKGRRFPSAESDEPDVYDE